MNIDKINKNRTLDSQDHILDGLKVLIAEDDKLNVLILKKILSNWNIETSIAENGRIAVEMAKTGYYDIILMDFQMPVMDGLEASKEIQKFDRDIPIVVVTSLSLADVMGDFNELGINDFVFKPINKDYLCQMLLKYAPLKNKGKKKILANVPMGGYSPLGSMGQPPTATL